MASRRCKRECNRKRGRKGSQDLALWCMFEPHFDSVQLTFFVGTMEYVRLHSHTPSISQRIQPAPERCTETHVFILFPNPIRWSGLQNRERSLWHLRLPPTHSTCQAVSKLFYTVCNLTFLASSLYWIYHPAGESVFYNSNILHCATYDSNAPRATLHASMGDTRGGNSRARNILQHGLNWMKEDTFRDGLDARGKAMLDRLIEMRESVDGDVGYSLAN